jgi:hypothetical protein
MSILKPLDNRQLHKLQYVLNTEIYINGYLGYKRMDEIKPAKKSITLYDAGG